jgi:hypothetical protein
MIVPARGMIIPLASLFEGRTLRETTGGWGPAEGRRSWPGPIAQLRLERAPDKGKVAGSTPAGPTTDRAAFRGAVGGTARAMGTTR